MFPFVIMQLGEYAVERGSGMPLVTNAVRERYE